ncbi:hypothetical protein EB001_03610 [bacterium]|nr:hypothetical protein [bacterium]
MVQEVINVGAFGNDGTGDPLRTAYIKTNNNFSQIFGNLNSSDVYQTHTAGANLTLAPGSANVVVANNGAIVANATNFTTMYANNATFNGQITTNTTYPIIGNLSGVASSATLATTAVYATTAGTAVNAQNFSGNSLPNVNTIGNLIAVNIAIANIQTLYSNSNIAAAGNLATTAYVLGNGYYLSGLSGVTPSTYGNSNVAAYLTIYNGNVLTSNLNVVGNVALRAGSNLVVSATSYITSPSGTNANINIDANGTGDVVLSNATTLWLKDTTQASSTITGAIVVQGGMGIAGNIYSSSNIVTTGNTFGSFATYTGNITGNNLVSSYDLIVGPAGTVPLTSVTAQFVESSTTYTQINIQNIGNGSSTSADIVATANNGNDSAYFVDLGINANNYNNSSFTITYPNDAYLYVSNGNIAVGTASTGKAIVFHTDGTLLANEAGRITSGRWVLGGTDDGSNKLQVTGNVTVSSNISVGNLTTSGNVTAAYHFGNGSTLSGMYGNTQASAYIGSYLPTYTGNLSAGNLVATGNVGGTYFIGNGSLLTGLYSNVIAAAYLPTYSGNINAGNVNTTSNVYATYFVGSSQYLTGLYSNTSVAAYLPAYFTANLLSANGVASNTYVLSYVTINGYTFANLANSSSNTVTLTGNTSTLILDYTTGGTVSVANVYMPANANISDGTRITISSNISVSSLRIIANDSTVQGNVSSISPTTPYSWHYVKYAPYNGNPIPQQLPGGPRWIRV